MIIGILIVALVIVALITLGFLGYIIAMFNGLVRLKNNIKKSWANIDVLLKQRSDELPKLIASVKGYMKHEKEVLTEITKARSNLMKGPIEKRAEASNQITEALKSLFAVAENYPDLKASENFKLLQEELSGTENKISYARQHYNDMVMIFNTKIELFPNSIFAKMMNFKKEDFFKTEGKERENVKVKF